MPVGALANVVPLDMVEITVPLAPYTLVVYVAPGTFNNSLPCSMSAVAPTMVLTIVPLLTLVVMVPLALLYRKPAVLPIIVP